MLSLQLWNNTFESVAQLNSVCSEWENTLLYIQLKQEKSPPKEPVIHLLKISFQFKSFLYWNTTSKNTTISIKLHLKVFWPNLCLLKMWDYLLKLWKHHIKEGSTRIEKIHLKVLIASAVPSQNEKKDCLVFNKFYFTLCI